MLLKLKRAWKSKGKNNPATKGKMRYAYIVTGGTKEERLSFKNTQGQFYVEDEEGNPLYMSPRKLHKSKADPWAYLTWVQKWMPMNHRGGR